MVGVREPNFRLVHATTFTTVLGTRAKIRRCLPQAGEKPRKSEETTTVRDPLKKNKGKKSYSYSRECGQGFFTVDSASSETMNVHAILEDIDERAGLLPV